MKKNPEKVTASSQAQKAYKPPSLTEYGNIRELTASGSKGGWEDGPSQKAYRM